MTHRGHFLMLESFGIVLPGKYFSAFLLHFPEK